MAGITGASSAMKSAHGPSERNNDQTQASIAFPPTLSAARVAPPPPPANALPRDGLARRLTDARGARIILLTAAAGYGKSTLLAQWYDMLLAGDTLPCWLTMNGSDNTPGQLLTYLTFSVCAALARAGITDIPDIPETSTGSADTEALVNRLHYAVARAGSDTLLILDDFHVLDETAVREVMEPLMRLAPPNLTLCFAGRNDGALDVSRLEAAGAVARIAQAALPFTRQDLSECFAQALSAQESAEAHERSRGWPVAVQLLARAFDQERDLGRALRNLGSEDGPLADYIEHQVLASLNEGQRRFLRDVSLLPEFDTGLADTLRDSDDALQHLHALRVLRPLLTPVDELPGTYRLHPLLREHLYRQLAQVDAQRLRALHARAATWCMEHDDLVNATRHSIAAGDPERVVTMIEDLGGISLWLREGITRIRSAMALLDEKSVVNSVRLLLLRCVIQVKDGHVFEAGKTFLAAERARRREHTAGDSPETVADYEIVVVEAYLALYAGRRVRETSYRQLLDSTDYIDPLDYDRLGFHYTLLCVLHTQQGDFASAKRHARDAIRVFRLMDSLYGENYIYFHAGDIAFAEGDGEQADASYRHGLELAKRHFQEDKGLRLIGHVLLIELLDELGREDYSLSILRSIPRELEAREAWFEIYAAGYCTVSGIELRSNGLQAALRLLDRAGRYSEAQQLGHLGALLLCQRVELLLRAGKVSRARDLWQKQGLETSNFLVPTLQLEDAGWREIDAAALAEGHLLLAEGRWNEVLEKTSPFAVEARKQGHLRSVLRYDLLLCLARAGLQETDAALDALAGVLAQSEESGFLRALLDAGDLLDDLLTQFIRDQHTDGLIAHAQSILDRRRRERGAAPKNPGLSRREREVVTLVADGQSNKQIARALDVSENTVRFHMKNLFAKLSVQNRTEAARQARERGLVA